MAAEAALVAEELGKIVSAQQIFVLRKAIYRLTAHSTNPHAVLYAHLPLRSASGALRQSRCTIGYRPAAPGCDLQAVR
jgi:hypothetical protein